jgi:hypothetical protein
MMPGIYPSQASGITRLPGALTQRAQFIIGGRAAPAASAANAWRGGTRTLDMQALHPLAILQ